MGFQFSAKQLGEQPQAGSCRQYFSTRRVEELAYRVALLSAKGDACASTLEEIQASFERAERWTHFAWSHEPLHRLAEALPPDRLHIEPSEDGVFARYDVFSSDPRAYRDAARAVGFVCAGCDELNEGCLARRYVLDGVFLSVFEQV